MIFLLLFFAAIQPLAASSSMGSPDVLVEQIALNPPTVCSEYLAIGSQAGSSLYYVSQVKSDGQKTSIKISRILNPTTTPLGLGETGKLGAPDKNSIFSGLGISADGSTLYAGWKTRSSISINGYSLVDGAPLLPFKVKPTDSTDSLVSLNCDQGKLYVVTSHGIQAFDTSKMNQMLWQISGLPDITSAVLGGGNLYLAHKNTDAGYISYVNNLAQYTTTHAPEIASVSIIVGSKNPGFVDGNGADARFTNIQGLAYYGRYLYVADTNNDSIRRVDVVDTNKPVVTIAGGLPTTGATTEIKSGTGTQAVFDTPMTCHGDCTEN
ncbi:hypothetical protein [Candidatus Finniella inopinata]|uniref:BPP domain-containing protein n=1 Tax=Candidatus Finniella inopinata TaxID=1696036 RepID=A0A4Q7DKC4_9PROT|nr:hypothetical protein [Candidatus Finniella inopinata]RZI46828.1 hypothetical protein EQU50_00975 [Candidatus Finniella inopinata]